MSPVKGLFVTYDTCIGTQGLQIVVKCVSCNVLYGIVLYRGKILGDQ
jgi:hypothetical protein